MNGGKRRYIVPRNNINAHFIKKVHVRNKGFQKYWMGKC